MSKKPHSQTGSFVTKIDLSKSEKLIHDLKNQGFELSKPQYTVFSAKKKGVSCTLYESGKLMVQGKEKDEFIEFYLEPQILGSFGHTYKELMVDKTARIGIDEAGKGDFFGPLCVGGVYADEKAVAALVEMGVKDSKAMSDKVILGLAKKIRAEFRHHVVRIGPSKYNELYEKFGNLNHLLAWGHATAIENLVKENQCQNVIIDQFASEHVVLNALRRKRLEVDLTQRHRGEEDVVVAAASIIARAAFLDGLDRLEKEFGMEIPKGASQKVIQAGKMFVRKHGKDQLVQVGKLHFKTLDSII